MTQPSAGSLPRLYVVGSMLGVAVVLGTFVALVWFQLQRKTGRRERPPQREKLLRPPGYFLLCRINELSDHAAFSAVQALAAGAFFGFASSTLYPLAEALLLGRLTFTEARRLPQSYLVLSILGFALGALLWTIRSVALAFNAIGKMEHCRFGLRLWLR